MSATNATTNYNFPLFIGTDKPAWLVDWNSAMSAIDAAIKGVDTDVQGAIVDISGLSSTVAAHTSSISTISGQITVITTNLNTATGNINTINSLIGNGTPTTTDQTLIGAINELHANQGDLADLTTPAVSLVAAINAITGGGGAVAASAVSYDNTNSGMTATNVQDAIDELKTDIGNIPSSADFAYVGEQTGATALSVPPTAKEILVYVQYVVSGGTVPCCSVAHFLTAMGKVYIDGGGYYGSTQGFYTRVGYDDTAHEVQLLSAQSDGSDVSSTTKLIVYAK
jgi:hypothetical protein